MKDILIKSAGFILIILLGAFSRYKGMVTKEDGKMLSKVAINIALPCALITGFAGVQFSFWMLVCFACGIFFTLVSLMAGRYLASAGCTPEDKANNMLCFSGFNGGSFALPFCQAFFAPGALAYLIMFDIGNSLMVFGISPAIVRSALQHNVSFDIKKFIKKLFSNIPFVVYVVLVAFSVLGIGIPQTFLTIISPIAQANVFIMMFTIGTQLELRIESSLAKNIAKIIAVRILIAAVLSVFVFMLPADILMKQALTIFAFAPLCSPSVMFAQEMELDTRLTAMVCSLSIIVGVVCYILLMMILL